MTSVLTRTLVFGCALALCAPVAAQSGGGPAANPPPAAAPRATVQGGDAKGTGLVAMDDDSMSDAQARAHFKVGQSLYQAGRFAEAGAEWEKAYALSARAPLLYNVYVAYRDAGDWKNAARALEQFLDKGEVGVEERPTLQARLEVMKREIAEREAAEAAAAEEADAPPAPEPEPAPAEPEAEPAAAGPSVVPWVVGGLGGAMIIAGIATGVVTLNKKSEIDDACEASGVCPADFDLDAKRDSAKTMALVTDVLLIGGGVAVATAVLLGLLLEGKPERKLESGALDCHGAGCTVTLYGRF